MKITVEEQQRRSERARLKGYARRRIKKPEKTPKQKQAGFKNMRLVNKPGNTPANKKHRVKIKKLPPGEAQGARHLQRWSTLRRG